MQIAYRWYFCPLLPSPPCFRPDFSHAAGRFGYAGRWLGLGLLCIVDRGIYSNFQLQAQVFAAPGFLFRAAGMPLHIGAIVLTGLVTALLSLALAAFLRGNYGRQQPDFLAADADSMLYEPARALLRRLRNGVHFPGKLLGGLGVMLMYLLLYRAHAIPRRLALAGMLACVLQ